MAEVFELMKKVMSGRIPSDGVTSGQTPSTDAGPSQLTDATAVAVGIDFGCTNTRVAIWHNGSVEVLPTVWPSCLSFDGKTILYGEPALAQWDSNPLNTIPCLKRLLGRPTTDHSVARDIKNANFKIKAEGNKPVISFYFDSKKKRFSVEEITGLFLLKIREFVEAHVNKPVINAVITVPACFNDAQRRATKNAGIIAGLNVLQLINEPTAASLSYLYKSRPTFSGKLRLVVFHLGGGTFDASVLNVERNMVEHMATEGDDHLGGEDFDQKLVDHFIQNIMRRHKTDIRNNKSKLSKLKRECEKAKIAICSKASVDLSLESVQICTNFSVDYEFKTKLRIEIFDALITEKLLKCIDLTRECLPPGDIGTHGVRIALIGGSTRIPLVRNLLIELFEGETSENNPTEIIHEDEDEVVAFGAAVQAAVLSGIQHATIEDLVVKDRTSHAIGMAGEDGNIIILISKHSQIPTAVNFKYKVDPFANEHFISLYEGDTILSERNSLIGKFVVAGVPKGKDVKLEMKLEVDKSGMVNLLPVTKRCLPYSFKKLSIRNDGWLPEEKLKSMADDVEDLVSEEAKLEFESYVAELENKAMNTDHFEKVEELIEATRIQLQGRPSAAKYREELHVLRGKWEHITNPEATTSSKLTDFLEFLGLK